MSLFWGHRALEQASQRGPRVSSSRMIILSSGCKSVLRVLDVPALTGRLD